MTGTKPAAFCRWVFTLLGAAPGDSLDDLFRGSGAVSRAWAAYTSRDPSRAPECRTSREVGDTSSPAASDASCKARADAVLFSLEAAR